VRVRAFFVLFAVFLILAASGVAWSQTVQGVITGTITDPTGAVVPGATVTITNVGTNAAQSATTGSDGSYRFPLVPPGAYTIEVKAANFAAVRASGVVVEASQTVPFSVKLELAKASQVIEVTSQAPLVQTATSDLATQIDRTTVLNTPLADRDVLATLPFLAPQVTPGIDMMPTSGGARESGTSYLLNGGDDNDNFSEGAVNIRPPLESVQDFTIKTNSMTAEYGRGAGAVVTVDQTSGTNKLHGALYEFNRNALLNANGYFYDRDLHNDTQGLLSNRPKYIRNQFGGEVDGPIKKDKTFFSFAYDRIKLLASTTQANTFVPTSAGLSYLLANAKGNGSGSASIAQQILKAYPPVTSNSPCPNVDTVDPTHPNGTFTGTGTAADGLPGYWDNGVPNPVGCLSFSDPETDTEDSYYGRVDHNFSSKDRLSAAVNIYRQSFVDQFGGGPLTTSGAINGTTTNHFHNITVNETHVFNPRLLNEVSIAHNRHFNLFIEGNGTNTIPSIVIDNQTGGCINYDLGGPFEGGQVEGFVQDRWGLKDNLTWTAGRHSLKFGGGSQYGILYRNWDLGLPGYYEFGELSAINTGGVATGPGGGGCPAGGQITPACDPGSNSTATQNFPVLQSDKTLANVVLQTNANFTNDYPYFMETSIDPATGAKASAYRHYTYHDYYVFAQDDWKVGPHLTLNLGLRWDRYGAPSEDHGILAQFINFANGSCDIGTYSCIANAVTGPVARMWNTQNHDFAPRVGFAWDVKGNGKMAVRGGFGIYYDRIFDNIWSNGAWNPPFYGLADFENDTGDAIFFSNPTSIGPGYNPSIPGCQIPNAANANCAGHRVSIRTMDRKMHDSSGQNFFLGVERQFLGNFLFRVNYQGSMGRHLPMLENYNRLDGDGYYNFAVGPTAIRGSQSPTRPNPLYSGFNYRSNSVSSNYNSLVAEVQKRMSNGLQFQTGYTFSKLLDVNSELFAGCSNVSLTSGTAPYYYISNNQPGRNYGRGGFDHRHAYKFSVTYELPFLKAEKGFVGHAFGGWQVGSFMQLYSGHPIDISNGRGHISAKMLVPVGGVQPNGTICTTPTYPASNPVDCTPFLLDQNGARINIGGDYNLDGVLNDHPNFLGSSLSSVYSGASPADGIFTDNNRIGCGEAGAPPTTSFAASSSSCVGFTPSTLFGNPAYPSGTTPYMRFGTLGRDVFVGPKFVQLDMSLGKTFKLTETTKLEFRAQAQNLLNHPSFDCIQSDLSKSTFGKALCLAQQNNGSSVGSLGAPISRIMSVGLRLAF
jgi:carboxypeptidase family protein/TonB-dependent receptor-like protein